MVRAGSQLYAPEDWRRLINGEDDVLLLRLFASADECAGLRGQVSGASRYETAEGVLRKGSSFSDVRKSNRLTEDYSRPDILSDFLRANDALARLIGRITASWPCGVEAFRYRGYTLQRLIARRLVGAGAEPHDDDLATEVADDPVAATVKVQLGVNLYIETPQEGGELEGWRRRMSSEEYDANRNAEELRRYGVRRDAIGPPDWEIKPAEGDVIIFRNSELHAIRGSESARSTCGFFLGFRGEEYPLLMWS